MSKNKITAGDRFTAQMASAVLEREISPESAAALRVDRESAARKAAPKLRKKYKRARRRLLELVVWSDPDQVMGVIPRDIRLVRPEDFDAELKKRAHAVAVAFDRYTEATVIFDPDIPKL